MRISPLVFYLMNKPINERFEITKQISSITHGHIRSVIACFYYLEFARQLIQQKDKFEIYLDLQTLLPNFLNSLSIESKEITLFDRILNQTIHDFPEDEIISGGYVIHTLEASIWCLLTTDSYKDAVLKAVNLGDDQILLQLLQEDLQVFCMDLRPSNWINELARKNDIENLAERMYLNLRLL